MRPLLALALLAGLLVSSGCSTTPTSGTHGTVRLQITDAPGPYDAVNLVVTQVAIHRGVPDTLEHGMMSDSTSGWEILRADSITVDLMTLRNGVFAMLAQGLVPAGHYTQIRLKLGEGSNVVVNGVAHPLKVPSGMQSGYKLVGQFDVPANGMLDLALDFDAERSIHQTGNGRYMLKPTCRVMPFSTAGSIGGHLLPEGTAAHIYAIVGPDTLASTTPGDDGRFRLMALAAGTYAVAIHPASGWRDTTLAGVAVTAQHMTDLGDITLTSIPD